MKADRSRNGWKIFRWPLLIAAVSLVGLLSALVGDGWYDLLSWLTLGSTLAVMAIAWRGSVRSR
jgi:hypothetical protein